MRPRAEPPGVAASRERSRQARVSRMTERGRLSGPLSSKGAESLARNAVSVLMSGREPSLCRDPVPMTPRLVSREAPLVEMATLFSVASRTRVQGVQKRVERCRTISLASRKNSGDPLRKSGTRTNKRCTASGKIEPPAGNSAQSIRKSRACGGQLSRPGDQPRPAPEKVSVGAVVSPSRHAKSRANPGLEPAKRRASPASPRRRSPFPPTNYRLLAGWLAFGRSRDDGVGGIDAHAALEGAGDLRVGDRRVPVARARGDGGRRDLVGALELEVGDSGGVLRAVGEVRFLGGDEVAEVGLHRRDVRLLLGVGELRNGDSGEDADDDNDDEELDEGEASAVVHCLARKREVRGGKNPGAYMGNQGTSGD